MQPRILLRLENPIINLDRSDGRILECINDGGYLFMGEDSFLVQDVRHLGQGASCFQDYSGDFGERFIIAVFVYSLGKAYWRAMDSSLRFRIVMLDTHAKRSIIGRQFIFRCLFWASTVYVIVYS